jgi:hypothetical protein
VSTLARINVARIVFLVAGIAVILAQPGGHDLDVALALAFTMASVAAWHLWRSYLARDPSIRMGRAGTFVLCAVAWAVVGATAFFFLYYPESVWRWS